MAKQPISTPCIGVCSTVYGDQVCRGCKRFAHEVIEWNGYEDSQKIVVRERLAVLRDQSVNEHLVIEDEARLRSQIAAHRIPCSDDASLPSLVYALLWRGASNMRNLSAYGLRARASGASEALDLMRAIDADFYVRSQAHYERNFRTIVR